MTWIVLGAGYTGARVATRLAADGAEVVVTRRSLAAAEAVAPPGTRACALDLAAPDRAAALAALFAPGDVVVVTAPPIDPHASGDVAIAAAAIAARVARVVYVSSTGVYGPGGGALVDEAWPLAPATGSGAARIAAETALAACGAVALRAAGIYGPDRGVIARLRAGTYRAIGSGRTATSRIHADDLATAILAAGRAATPAAVYNVADDDPAPSADLVDAAVAALGVAPPPAIALDAVDPELAAMVAADRRIDNRRLKSDLGVVLRYPSWRDAFAEELRAR